MQLTSKQRAELRRMGQRLAPVVWVGKAGISPALVRSADEALTARELVKGRVQPEAAVSAEEAATRLSEACQAASVGVIGRTFLLYRPNNDKLRVHLEV